MHRIMFVITGLLSTPVENELFIFSLTFEPAKNYLTLA